MAKDLPAATSIAGFSLAISESRAPARVSVEEEDLRTFGVSVGRNDGRLGKVLFGFVEQNCSRRLRGYAVVVRVAPAASERFALIKRGDAIRSGALFVFAVKVVGAGENRSRFDERRAISNDSAERAAVGRSFLIGVLRIKLNRDSDLMKVRQAGRGARFLAGGGQSRKQKRRQNANNGNDNEQFDDCETAT